MVAFVVREARVEHRRDVAQRLHVLVGEPFELGDREADAGPQPLDQLRLEPRLLGHLVDRPLGVARREEVLNVAVGQPAVRRGLADLVEAVPAVA